MPAPFLTELPDETLADQSGYAAKALRWPFQMLLIARKNGDSKDALLEGCLERGKADDMIEKADKS